MQNLRTDLVISNPHHCWQLPKVFIGRWVSQPTEYEQGFPSWRVTHQGLHFPSFTKPSPLADTHWISHRHLLCWSDPLLHAPVVKAMVLRGTPTFWTQRQWQFLHSHSPLLWYIHSKATIIFLYLTCLCRHAILYLQSQHITGCSKATHLGLAAGWHSISRSSQLSNPGGKRSSIHFFCGGISMQPYLSYQSPPLQPSFWQWHNSTVLLHLHGGVHMTSLNNAPAPGSAAVMMLQWAANTAHIARRVVLMLVQPHQHHLCNFQLNPET